MGVKSTDGNEITELVIQTNAIKLNTSTGWKTIDSTPNNDGYHVTRINKTTDDKIWVWRDNAQPENPINGYVDEVTSGDYTLPNFIAFGDFATGGSGDDSDELLDAEVDYIAFQLGEVHTPEPATLMVLVSGMAACLLVKRR